MKFKLKQDKLQEMFEKLLMGDIFPSSIIATKEGKLTSIQREEEGSAIRFAKFDKNYFEEIDPTPDAVKIDVVKALSLIKLVPSTESITVEKRGDKVFFTDSEGETFVPYEDPKGQLIEKMPFEVKDGVPYVGKGKIPLTTKFTADLIKFKLITTYGKTLKTEYYKFTINPDKTITTKIGDLHSFSAGREHRLPGEVLAGESLEVYLTFGIPQISDTFREDKFTVQTLSHSPALFSESSKEKGYTIGMLVPPYVEED